MFFLPRGAASRACGLSTLPDVIRGRYACGVGTPGVPMSANRLFVALVAFASLPAAADSIAATEALEKVIVTATRMETTLGETLASVDVNNVH